MVSVDSYGYASVDNVSFLLQLTSIFFLLSHDAINVERSRLNRVVNSLMMEVSESNQMTYTFSY